MANSLISMIKGDSTLINNTEVLDGQVLFNTDEKTISLDDGGVRANYSNSADNINKNLAYIENGNSATRGYSAGAFIIWKGQLYRALVQINSGTAFSVGTNIVADTMGAELTQTNADTSWYGTCSTAAGTTAKIATTTDSKFTLVTGAKVQIKFTYANTAPAPTLNVDSKGAKSIKAYGTTAPTMWWRAGDVVEFTYDGTNWIMGATQGEIEQLNSDLEEKVTYGTTALVETNFSLNSTSQAYAVSHTGTYCITIFTASTTPHNASVEIGGIALGSGLLNYQYDRISVQVPLRVGTAITLKGEVGDGVNINYLQGVGD